MFSLSLMKTVVSYGKKHFHECFCFQNPLTKIVLVIIFCNYTIKLIHKRVNQTLHIDYNFLCNGNVGLLQICHYNDNVSAPCQKQCERKKSENDA